MGFSCLEDWIGVQGCNGNTSNSGVYLNDLAGIELRNIDEIANEEQVNFSGVWDDIQTRALNRFQTDVISGFSKKYRLKMLTQGIDVGKEIDTTVTTASGAQYRGLKLELNDESDKYAMSNLQVIYIQKIRLYLSGAVNTTLKVYDLDLGTQLYSSALTGSAGWNEVNVNTIFTARRIYVCYDATTVTSVKLDLTDLESCGCFCNCGVDIDGAYSATASPTTLTSTDTSYGLSLVFSVQCKYDNLVCNNRELFTQPLLYCLGIEFCTEAIYSPRMNRWTTTDAKKMKMLRQEFEAKYKGGTIDDGGIIMSYSGELSTVLDSIQMDMSDCCLECNQPIMYKDANV